MKEKEKKSNYKNIHMNKQISHRVCKWKWCIDKEIVTQCDKAWLS